MCFRLVFILFLLVATTARGDVPDTDDGIEGSMRLRFPEPMVFDLVRPLGAVKGEFEINSLVRIQHGAPAQWAPEIEYAFRKGTALEFELPLEDRSIESYKLALQHTLPMRKTRAWTHGLQGIGEFGGHSPDWRISGLYIAGVRWKPRWSTLSMLGIEQQRRRTIGLLNHSFFYERWRTAALGVETNVRIHPRAAGAHTIPQLHFRVFDRVNLQVGAGFAPFGANRTPTWTFRLVREI